MDLGQKMDVLSRFEVGELTPYGLNSRGRYRTAFLYNLTCGNGATSGHHHILPNFALGIPLDQLLSRGQRQSPQCYACHNVNSSQPDSKDDLKPTAKFHRQ